MTSTIEELVAKLKATRSEAWQYLEVKQLAEILSRHREKLRLAVREYRLLKQTLAAETDAIEKLYLSYEGMFMRDHLRDTLRLYLIVNRDYHEAYESYFDAVKNPPVETYAFPLMMEPVMKALPGKRLSVQRRRNKAA